MKQHLKNYKVANPDKIISVIPLLIGTIFSFVYHAMYQTMDDLDMRFVFEGSAGNRGPQDFALYTNIYYGKFLKFFYSIWNNFFWYDFFEYFFMSISFFMISYSFCKFILKETYVKILFAAVISMFCCFFFVQPQFTQVSGILTISSMSVIYVIFIADLSKKEQIFFAAYFVLAITFSFLIREMMCLTAAFYASLAFLPLYLANIKKITHHFFRNAALVAVSLLCIFLFHVAGQKALSQNRELSDAQKMNMARAEIQDKTSAWDHYDIPWKGLENKIPDQPDGYVFTKEDYRMLLATFFLGNTDVLNAENLKKASDALKDEMSIRKTRPVGFYISNSFRKVFVLLAAFCILGGILKSGTLFCAYNVALFYFMIVFLNIDYKSTPQRVWINLLMISFLPIFVSLRSIAFNKFHYIASAFAVLLLFFFAREEGTSAQIKYEAFKIYRKEIRKVPLTGLFWIDGTFAEISSSPFQQNLYKKNNINYILMSPLNVLPVYRDKLKAENISMIHTYKDLCNNNFKSITFSSINKGQFLAYVRALQFYIKNKYGKDVVFFSKHLSENIQTYQCHILSDKEQALIKKFKKETKNIIVSKDHKQKMSYLFAIKELGTKASLEKFYELVQLLNAEHFE